MDHLLWLLITHYLTDNKLYECILHVTFIDSGLMME